MSDKKKPNPLSVLTDIAGAVGGGVNDFMKEVRQDLREMTPQQKVAAKGGLSAEAQQQHASGSQGMAFVEVGGGDDTNALVNATPAHAGRSINPWEDTAKKGRMCVDACFLAQTDDDIFRYIKGLEGEDLPPFALPILSADLADAALTASMLGALKSEPRAFGAIGQGPRHVVDDLDALDEQLTALLNEHPKLLAIGPIGLDEPYAPYTLPQQIEQMILQLEIAADFDIPAIVIHQHSLDKTIAVLSQLEVKPRLIWGSLLGTEEDIAFVRKLDAYVLIRPEITYESHRLARENMRRILPERWLLASGDSLMSPQARSGHANGPQGLKHTLKAFAELMDIPTHDLREQLNANARRVFKAD